MTTKEMLTELETILKNIFQDFDVKQGIETATTFKKDTVSYNVYGMDIDNVNRTYWLVQIYIQKKKNANYFDIFNNIVDKMKQLKEALCNSSLIVYFDDISFPINENEYNMIEAIMNIKILWT